MFLSESRDITDLGYLDKVFPNKQHAENFLRIHFEVTDDCAGVQQLFTTVEHVPETTCNTTYFDITPWQDYPDCGKANDYENPLSGRPQRIIFNVDEEEPIVTCGFETFIGADVSRNGTLFHYMKSDEGRELKDSYFFFNVEVSWTWYWDDRTFKI